MFTASGTTTQAINDCSAAISLNDRASMAYNHRGYAYEMKKDLDHAIADYKKALEIDPQNNIARDKSRTSPKIRKA